MSPWITPILSRLDRVRALRRQREADPGSGASVRSVKEFQHARFMRDYAALLVDPRYGKAAKFFLEEIYGPADFAGRDAEFERVVPLMARVLPDDVMGTIAELIELHALTEELDQQMAAALGPSNVDDRSYRAAWLQVDRRPDRDRQLELLLRAGRALDRYTGNKMLSATLRVMRAPARAAGLGRLQSFLETGLSTFAAMGGAGDFLRLIQENEKRAIDDFFAPK